MKKEQSVYNKLHKFSAKEIELASKEKIKVEFSSVDELKKILGFVQQTETRLKDWLSKRDDAYYSYAALEDEYNQAKAKFEKIEAEFNKADKEFGIAFKEMKSANDSFEFASNQVEKNISEYKQFKKAADAAIASFAQKAKEVGVDANSLPEVKALKGVLSSIQAIASNV